MLNDVVSNLRAYDSVCWSERPRRWFRSPCPFKRNLRGLKLKTLKLMSTGYEKRAPESLLEADCTHHNLDSILLYAVRQFRSNVSWPVDCDKQYIPW